MKKRLLFFTNSLYGGGAEKVLQTLLCNLDLNKYDITLYSVNEGVLNASYPKGINYKYIFKQNSTSLLSRLWAKIYNKFKLIIYYKFSSRTFYRLFVKGEYDTEIAFIEGYSTRIVSGSTNHYSKKLAWVHIDLKNNHWTDIAYKNIEEENECYSKFDNIFCVSSNVVDSMKCLFPNLNTLEVKYNPIDDNKIKYLSNIIVPLDLCHNKCVKLVSNGRLVHQKGYDRLLPIAKRLIEDGHNITLTILGEGCDRISLEKYISENKLNEYITLPGFVENPYSIMSQHDIFVCSSRSEGFSTAVTEALILGLPVITTDCSGMKELLGENNEYGIVIQNDDDALYIGLKQLLSNPTNFEFYKKKSLERGKFFSLENQILEIEKNL